MLLGPNQRHTRVLEVVKRPLSDYTVIHLATSDSFFSITADHRLLVKFPNGIEGPSQAEQLYAGFAAGEACQIFNGVNYQPIEDANREIQHIQVLDICFDDPNATVLAWFPKGGRRKLRSNEPFVAFGREVADRLTLEHGRGFAMGSKISVLERLSQLAISEGRARSQGATPDPYTAWSRGTRNHNEADPNRCATSPGICSKHRLFVQASTYVDGNGDRRSSAQPCKKGADCEFCHARHPEQKKRIR